MTAEEHAIDGWERHRRDQIKDIARRTTPAQRLAMLEQLLEFARKAGARPRDDILREARDKGVS